MKTVRLLPIVVFAASALLVLKTIGIVTGGGYTLSGMSAAVAQDEPVAEAQPEGGAAQLAAAEAAARALFEGAPAPSAEQPAIETWEIDGTGVQAEVGGQGGATQNAILERLSERRAELDALASELDTRLAVVEAAEVRIEERMAELSEVEARINATVAARDAAEAEQFAALVAMYENMRASDAATIFNSLDATVLVSVGREMNPRKLGPIMAKMVPERAQELTVRLARADEAVAEMPAEGDYSQLPQIMGQ